MRKSTKPIPTSQADKFTVKESTELMTFIISKMGGMSRNSVKSLLSHRQVSVNDKIVTQYNFSLKSSDIVAISHSRGNIELSHPKLKVIYEDSDIIVVEKKEGLLSVTTGKEVEITAFQILKNYVKKSSSQNKIYVVHRLDRETSGILVFAKSREIQLILQENWYRIVTKRIYVALVEGKVEKENEKLVSWLKEHEKSLKIRSYNDDNGGQMAVTNYRRIKFNEKFSLLEIELETGRKNQIRVHMESIGHPVVGDKKYSSAFTNFGRLALHARILEFYHPTTEKKVHFETPVPREFLKVFH
ncbi:MAG: RluA family pseudouridine synthase [Paludibacteraceae bacterium]